MKRKGAATSPEILPLHSLSMNWFITLTAVYLILLGGIRLQVRGDVWHF